MAWRLPPTLSMYVPPPSWERRRPLYITCSNKTVVLLYITYMPSPVTVEGEEYAFCCLCACTHHALTSACLCLSLLPPLHPSAPGEERECRRLEESNLLPLTAFREEEKNRGLALLISVFFLLPPLTLSLLLFISALLSSEVKMPVMITVWWWMTASMPGVFMLHTCLPKHASPSLHSCLSSVREETEERNATSSYKCICTHWGREREGHSACVSTAFETFLCLPYLLPLALLLPFLALYFLSIYVSLIYALYKSIHNNIIYTIPFSSLAFLSVLGRTALHGSFRGNHFAAFAALHMHCCIK